MKVRPILEGFATYIPGLRRLVLRRTGGTVSARYCYSVWLRHLTMAHDNGLSTEPSVIAELGPGDSLGVGLAALLSGSDSYYGFDVVKYANFQRNIAVFEELIKLFQARESIPDQSEFPRVKPYLNSYKFPHHILTDERLEKALHPHRLEAIRRAIQNIDSSDDNHIQISYFVPWYDPKVVKEVSVDMILSQGALQDINNLPHTYETMYRWLKPGGFMSHQIDHKCQGTATKWNGHWAYSDLQWKVITGKRPYILNREPHSTYVDLLGQFNFRLVCDKKVVDASGIPRKELATRFNHLSNDDLVTSGAFIQAQKQ